MIMNHDDVNDVMIMIMAQVLDSPQAGAAAPEWRPGEDGIEGKRAKPSASWRNCWAADVPVALWFFKCPWLSWLFVYII